MRVHFWTGFILDKPEFCLKSKVQNKTNKNLYLKMKFRVHFFRVTFYNILNISERNHLKF